MRMEPGGRSWWQLGEGGTETLSPGVLGSLQGPLYAEFCWIPMAALGRKHKVA